MRRIARPDPVLRAVLRVTPCSVTPCSDLTPCSDPVLPPRRCYPEIEEPTVVLAMRRLGDVWKQLFPEEQARLVNLLIERVQLLSDGIDIVWREVGWKDLAGELAPDAIGGELLEMEGVA